MTPEPDAPAPVAIDVALTPSGPTVGGVLKRAALLLASGVVLYLLAPGLITVFGSWRDLESVNPLWFVVMIVAEALSFAFVSFFTKLILPSASVFGITCAQLAGHALSTVVPGGAATGGAVEYRMMVRSGADPAAVGSAMTVQGVVLTAAVFVLPLFALPTLLLGAAAPDGLVQTAYLGFGVFVLLAAFGVALMVSDRAVRFIAAVVGVVLRIARRRFDQTELTARLLVERTRVRGQLGRHWVLAVVFSVGKWLLEYVTLTFALAAVGAHPRPSLVLLAYTASALLSMIPVTPGGLGFVEAGLAGTLALAGVPAAQVAVATLAYRLVTYWLPLPVGLGAWVLFRRHYQRPSDDTLLIGSAAGAA